MARQTISRRLVRVILPWYGLLVIIVAAGQLTARSLGAREDISNELHALAATVAPVVAEAVWQIDSTQLKAAMQGIRDHPSITSVAVRDEKGTLLEAISDTTAGAAAALAVSESVPLYHVVPGRAPQQIGTIELDAGSDVLWRRIRYDLITKLVDSLIVGMGSWLIVVLAIHFRLSRNVTQLATAVQQWTFKPGDTSVHDIGYPYRDELGDLVQAMDESHTRLLNSMQALASANENLERIVGERTEALRIAKDRAESADRLKSAFLATMSHELRTPLNSIIGFTGILLQGLAGSLNEEQRKQLGMVRTSSRHLLSLINDVLDISKIEAGELHLARAPFDLLDSVRKIVGTMEPIAQRQQLVLAVELPAGLQSIAMLGDARRIEQVLLNLLSNALKFTEKGKVTLSVGVQPPLPATHDVGSVEIRVSDTGPGIREEHMDLLFKPFRQVDLTLARKHEGTGLGLAICHRLVTMMGGVIQAHSTWGVGSTFTVRVPMQAPDPDTPAATPLPAAGARTVRTA